MVLVVQEFNMTYYKVSEERLKELLEGYKAYQALSACGVDNWQGCEEAYTDEFGWDNDELSFVNDEDLKEFEKVE